MTSELIDELISTVNAYDPEELEEALLTLTLLLKQASAAADGEGPRTAAAGSPYKIDDVEPTDRDLARIHAALAAFLERRPVNPAATALAALSAAGDPDLKPLLVDVLRHQLARGNVGGMHRALEALDRMGESIFPEGGLGSRSGPPGPDRQRSRELAQAYLRREIERRHAPFPRT